MLIAIVSALVLIVLIVVFIEYKNSKKYKEQREEEKNVKTTPTTRGRGGQETLTRKPAPKTEPKPKPKIETQKETKELPQDNYSKFDHSRIIDTLGLSEEDAGEFIQELISQVDSHLSPIKEATKSSDYEELERLTHSIKGSATNLGEGGIADLLTDFNTYLKIGKDIEIVERYFELLEEQAQKLREQYS